MTGEKRLLLFIPLLLIIHNAEEALFMPQWISTHLSMLQQKFFFFRYLEFSSKQLYTSLLLVTAVPGIVSYLCLRGGQSPKTTAVMLTLQSVIFWNALVPHLSGLLLLGIYNPGTVSAVLVNIPFSLYLFRRSDAFILPPKFPLLRILRIGALIYLPLVYTNHLLAKSISRLF
jgi:hypothetical protein